MGFESVQPPDPMQTKIKLLETDLHEANRRLQAELHERQRSQQILQAIVEGTSSSTGNDFFRSLVYHLAIALQVRYGLVTEVVHMAEQTSQIRVQTLAFWSGNSFGNDFAYPLRNGPCEQVFASGQHQFFPDQVQTLFPNDIDLERIEAQSYLATPLTSSSGEILGHLAVLDDKPLTDGEQKLAILEIFAARAVAEMERIRSENALKARETELRTLFSGMTDVVMILDDQGYYRNVAPTSTQTLYRPPDTIIGLNLTEIHTPERAAQFLSYIRQVTTTQEAITVDYTLPFHGEDVWFSTRISPLSAHEVIWVARNVTQLKQSELMNQSLLSAIPDMMMRVNRNGILLDFRPSRFVKTVVPEECIMGKCLFDILPPDIAQRRLDGIHQALQTGETQFQEYPLSVQGQLWYEESRIVPCGEDVALLIVRDITDRKLAEEALRQETEKSEHLLLNILPKAIADQLKDNPAAIADQFEAATILFADIVGFTQLSSQISAVELVGLLNRIFSMFDALSEQYGLEKIKTIGDAYMVVGGVPNPCPDHVATIVDMALAMQREISKLRTHDQQPISLRIGIHTGSVIAGVIGTRKFSYDLWGDTVNTASRMESHGEAGKIQVTQAVYDRLQHRYQFEPRGTIEVKGKGTMSTYWLVG